MHRLCKACCEVGEGAGISVGTRKRRRYPTGTMAEGGAELFNEDRESKTVVAEKRRTSGRRGTDPNPQISEKAGELLQLLQVQKVAIERAEPALVQLAAAFGPGAQVEHGTLVVRPASTIPHATGSRTGVVAPPVRPSVRVRTQGQRAAGEPSNVGFVEKYLQKHGPSQAMDVATAMEKAGLKILSRSYRQAARNALRQMVRSGRVRHVKDGYKVV